MAIIVDVILVLIIAYNVWTGYKQGLINALAGIASMILAALCTLMFLTPVTNYINDNYMADYVSKQTISTLQINIDEASNDDFLNALSTKAEEFKAVGDKLGIKNEKIDEVVEKAKTMTEDKEGAVQEVTAPLSQKISRVMAFIILFAAMSVLVRIILAAVNGFFQMPLLRGANKLLGAGIGAIEGVVIVFIASLLIYNILPKLMAIPGSNIPFGFALDSYIVNLLGKINILSFL